MGRAVDPRRLASTGRAAKNRAMARWICPRCDREFGSRQQSHTCVPGTTVAESLAHAQPWMRDCFELIMETVRECGPVHDDAVGVGVFLKADRKLAEFRPRARTVQLILYLPEPIDHPRLIRVHDPSAVRVVHLFTLRSVEEVDDDLLGYVAEAYDYATN